MSFWFRRKYNLPPTDPRYLDMTPEGIEEEFWAHHYFDNPATESDEDTDFDADAVVAAMESDEWEEIVRG